MKKYIQTALVVLIFLGLIFGGSNLSFSFRRIPTSMTQIEMIEQSMQSVVAVYRPDYDIPASGFYIGNGIIITAGHIAETENLEKVVFEDGDEYKIIKQIVHPDYDCGFLLISEANDLPHTFPHPNEPSLEFDLAEVQRGEEIFILGNPSGFLFLSTKGIIVGRRDNINGLFGDTLLIVSDAAGQGGNSGSVLVDKDGEIRGVWIGGYTSRCGAFLTGCGLSIPVNDILEALEQAGLEIE